MLCRTIKINTSKIYRQLNSTLPLFLHRSPRCFRVRPAKALHVVEEFSQLRRRFNARHDAEPQLRRRFNFVMTSAQDGSRADFPLAASSRGGCLAALEFRVIVCLFKKALAPSGGRAVGPRSEAPVAIENK